MYQLVPESSCRKWGAGDIYILLIISYLSATHIFGEWGGADVVPRADGVVGFA